MIKKLSQFDEQKRKNISIAVIVLTLFICCGLLLQGPVDKLQTARADYQATMDKQTQITSDNLSFHELQLKLTQSESLLTDLESRCCSPRKAQLFFETLNSLIVDNGLDPISTRIQKPQNLEIKEVLPEKDLNGNEDEYAEYDEQQDEYEEEEIIEIKPVILDRIIVFQVAVVIVKGDYFGIQKLLHSLTKQPNRPFIGGFHLYQHQANETQLRASFSVGMVIDMSSGNKL